MIAVIRDVPDLLAVKGGFVIAVDSTGLKMLNRGEWLREISHVHQGWVKVHAAGEVTSGAVVGIALFDERADDARFLRELVLQAEAWLPVRVRRVLKDSAYDKLEDLDFLKADRIEAGTKSGRARAASRWGTGGPGHSRWPSGTGWAMRDGRSGTGTTSCGSAR